MDEASQPRLDKFTELTVFLCVVEEGSFSAAARRLERSPSSVSKAISRLEARLQVRLFDRIAGSIRLTQEGHRFRHAAQQVIDAMAEAENAVSPADEDVAGILHIHTSLTFAKYQLAPLLPGFLQRHPRLRIKFIIGTDRGDFLKKGIDVAIHSGNPTELSLIGKPLFPRRWIVAAAPAYLEANGRPEHPEDLQNHRCLGFTIRTQWNAWTFLDQPAGPKDVMQDVMAATKTVNVQGYIGADQGELLRSLALQGLGIVRLAEFHIGADVAAGRLVPLLSEYMVTASDTMYVLYPPGRAPAPRVKAFLRFLDEHFTATHDEPGGPSAQFPRQTAARTPAAFPQLPPA